MTINQMDFRMRNIRYLLMLILLIYLPTGCAPRVTYVVDLAYTPDLKKEIEAKPWETQIAVVPFKDARANKGIIGTRTRILGRIDEFEARPELIDTALTQAMISALKIHGYRASVLRKDTEVESLEESPPHIVLSGMIEELKAVARSKPGYTDIETRVRLKVKVYKVDEKSSYTVNIQSQSEPRVIFFNPGVMQNAVNGAITEAINHLIENQITP